MKRKASSAVSSPQEDDDDVGEPRRAAPRLAVDDDFLVHEILPRLPAHAARPFAAASASFRAVLTDRDYWQARRAHSHHSHPGPYAACLVVRGSDGDDGGDDARFLLHEFHYADAACASSPAPRPAVARAAGGSLAPYRLAGTCDGLVLLTAPWNNRSRARAVVFNPASGAEVTLDLPATTGGGCDVYHSFCGFGYSPSSRAYKALLCAYDARRSYGACLVDVELSVVSLGGGAGAGAGVRERRRVAVVRCRMHGNAVPTSLSLDGKVYIFVDTGSSGTKVLAVDVDDGTVAYVEPPPIGRRRSELMVVWGRPCVATGSGCTVLFWTLMPEDHRWELRGSVTARSKVHGAWDCGDGRLFAAFRDGRGCMYDLQKPAALAPRVGAAALVPPELQNYATFCWGYQPTLVPPATVFGGAAVACHERHGLGQFSNVPNRPRKSGGVVRRPCLELLMETMRTLRAEARYHVLECR